MWLDGTVAVNPAVAFARAPLLVALAVLLPGRELPAQAGDELDSGTYEILMNGQVVGLERFVVQNDGTVIRAAGRVSASAVGAAILTGEVRVQLDQEYRPDRYELKPSNGALVSVIGLRRGGRLRLQTESDAGERVKEFVAPDDLVVLERGIAHHYFLLLGLVRGAADGDRVSLVVPSEGRQFRATVRDEGEESIPFGGGTLQARRYALEGEGERHAVWAAADGRVLRVEVPGSGWAAQRLP
ncbi:MAG: hypothetical protein JSV95_07835 [Gemmatimonadota bacterium]|jgi:hypothetical protein|nr:MAG: hypothetical protein JSV95_07835 [Gemmatimonadota bacterium]